MPRTYPMDDVCSHLKGQQLGSPGGVDQAQGGDRIRHFVHRHEPPVLDIDVQVRCDNITQLLLYCVKIESSDNRECTHGLSTHGLTPRGGDVGDAGAG